MAKVHKMIIVLIWRLRHYWEASLKLVVRLSANRSSPQSCEGEICWLGSLPMWRHNQILTTFRFYFLEQREASPKREKEKRKGENSEERKFHPATSDCSWRFVHRWIWLRFCQQVHNLKYFNLTVRVFEKLSAATFF